MCNLSQEITVASLQDQLLKAGLVDKKKAKQVKQEKRKQIKQQPKGQEAVNETAERARQALKEKAEKDRQMNLERQKEAEQKALKAQVKQIITQHRIRREEGDVPYQFVDNNKIKKIYVTQAVYDQLVRGQVGIAALNESYELIPRVIADKIIQRDPEAMVKMPEKATDEQAAEDDPYADYPIPDDLMW